MGRLDIWSMKLSTTQVVTNSPQKTPPNNSLRSNSFSGIEETAKNEAPKLRRASIQTPSLILHGRRASVCGTLLNVPGSLKRELSDPILEQQEKQPILLRRGSIAPRMRSGSVFGKSLGLPAGLLRTRRRSRFLSAREIKIFQVSAKAQLREVTASSGASFFGQRRARNASDTRLVSEEAQGSMSRRINERRRHLSRFILPENCHREEETSVYEAGKATCARIICSIQLVTSEWLTSAMV